MNEKEKAEVREAARAAGTITGVLLSCSTPYVAVTALQLAVRKIAEAAGKTSVELYELMLHFEKGGP